MSILVKLLASRESLRGCSDGDAYPCWCLRLGSFRQFQSDGAEEGTRVGVSGVFWECSGADPQGLDPTVQGRKSDARHSTVKSCKVLWSL